jgi:uncharacterized membrane protein
MVNKSMAGEEGFEPPILGPEPSALPLGHSPLIFVVPAKISEPYFVGIANRCKLYRPIALKSNKRYNNAMMHPIDRSELWHAELTLFVAILLQLTISDALRLGPKYLVAGFMLLLVFGIAFTGPRRHIGHGGVHKTFSTLLIAIVSLANAAELALLTKALIHGGPISGKSLLSGALAIFLTNIIVFGLWYWELDGPGLSGGHRGQQNTNFQFPQQGAKRSWTPTFFDYLYTSLTNSTAFSPTDTMPLTHVAKALMSVQALIALVTVVLVTARAVNILG